MKLVDFIEIGSEAGPGRIELFLGSLTQIPREHYVDVLVVSAFPNDYLPTPNSLIGNLHRRGLDIEQLAADPEADLRANFSCWISREITHEIAGLSFRRVLCFEPLVRGSPPELVGDIFRALAPFTYSEPAIRSLAMPIVAAGDQRHSITTMLSALLTAATSWIAIGFPVRTIKIVVRDHEALTEATPVFRKFKSSTTSQGTAHSQATQPSVTPSTGYDVFVSYSRRDEEAARCLSKKLKDLGYRVFIDQSEIDVGAAWQQRIFEALESCAVTAALYSPDFLSSKVCLEEFNIAWARRRETGRNMIFPLLIRDTALPTYMRMLNYVDCRISDRGKIESAASKLASTLNS
jgi:hypothetical protein